MILEVLGVTNAGKTTALRNITQRLSDRGISYDVVIETAGRHKFPGSQRGTLEYNKMVGKITCERIKEVLDNTTSDIVLIDKGLVDYKYFVEYYYQTGKCTAEEAEEAKDLYDYMGILPDAIVFFTCSEEVSFSRRKSNSTIKRTVSPQKSIEVMSSFYSNWNQTPKYLIDTSEMTPSDVIDSLESIINDLMRNA